MVYTVYIAGPMRGLPDSNHAVFCAAEAAIVADLKWQASCGDLDCWEVINPARAFDGDKSRPLTDYMRTNLEGLLRANIVVLLPGWEKSEGALREVEVATWTGKEFALATESGLGWDFELIPAPSVPTSPRAEVLDETKALVSGDRNNAYGPPTQDFRRSADMMTALGYRHTNLPASAPPCAACGARPLRPHDTAVSVTTIKLSRIMWKPRKKDNWVDGAGYFACGYECVVEEELADVA